MSKSINPFIDFLRSRLGRPLPGKDAQLKMCPVPKGENPSMRMEPTQDAHPSSVLIPIYPDQNQNLNLIFTLRTDSIRHAGQISFPGGRSDRGESLEETALRETEEEIFLNRNLVTVIGHITPLYLYRTNNQITPWVAYLEKEPELRRNPGEVEEIIRVPLAQLVNNEYKKRETWELSHNTFEVPFWDIHSTPLWGATAMITSELVELYKEFEEEAKNTVEK